MANLLEIAHYKIPVVIGTLYIKILFFEDIDIRMKVNLNNRFLFFIFFIILEFFHVLTITTI